MSYLPYLLAAFGALMALLSIAIVVSPRWCSEAIVRFCDLPYFHPFEIVSRLVFGVLFIAAADQTLYPRLMLVIGWVLVAVGVGLALTPPSRHRAFGVWSARKFRKAFRPAGIGGIVFGLFIVYAAVGRPAD